ncbi:PKD domain-containing protein [bacterium]|nr:PKD domain-containing protein [bacterium]
MQDINANGSSDPDGTIVKWEWQCFSSDIWCDFTPTSGAAQFTHNAAGVFTAKLRVTDDFGATATTPLP